MNSLDELIGRKVNATIEDESGSIEFKCKIVDLSIESFCFEEKGEPIYISVNVEPLEDLQMYKDLEPEDLNRIPLENIRKLN